MGEAVRHRQPRAVVGWVSRSLPLERVKSLGVVFFWSVGDGGLGETAGGRGPGGLHHRGDPRPHGSAHPQAAQPQCAVSDRVLRDRAGGAAGACPPAGRFPAHRHRRRHRIRVCFRQCTRCRPGRRDGVGRHRKERPRARDASGPWGSLLVSGPQGPVEWSDSGAPGRQRRGLAHESLSEVFHRVVSLWATFRGTTR